MEINDVDIGIGSLRAPILYPYNQFAHSTHYSAVKTEEACSIETFVNIYKATWRHIP
jgi:hypothetical protein